MELHVPAGHAGNIQHRWRLQLLAELHLLIAYGKHTIKHHPIVNIATRDFGATTRSAAAGTIAACPKQNSEKCYLNVTNKRKWPRDRDIFQNRPSGRQFNRFLPLNPIKTATYQRFLLVKNDVDSICRSPNGRAGGRGGWRRMKENCQTKWLVNLPSIFYSGIDSSIRADTSILFSSFKTGRCQSSSQTSTQQTTDQIQFNRRIWQKKTSGC